MLFALINKYAPINIKNDVLSGLTVALALVPEAVAFALLAGVSKPSCVAPSAKPQSKTKNLVFIKEHHQCVCCFLCFSVQSGCFFN